MKKQNFWILSMVALIAFGFTLSSFSTIEGSETEVTSEEVVEECEMDEWPDTSRSTDIWAEQRGQTSITIGECEEKYFYTNFVLNPNGYHWSVNGVFQETTPGSAIMLRGSDFLPGGSTTTDVTTTLSVRAGASPTTASITVIVLDNDNLNGPCIN
ncbi:MAG: hypothetical protein R8G66_30105 [Cytophagales bacterium]|nr:hypothetical protein [Cytophagales bacterium]